MSVQIITRPCSGGCQRPNWLPCCCLLPLSRPPPPPYLAVAGEVNASVHEHLQHRRGVQVLHLLDHPRALASLVFQLRAHLLLLLLQLPVLSAKLLERVLCEIGAAEEDVAAAVGITSLIVCWVCSVRGRLGGRRRWGVSCLAGALGRPAPVRATAVVPSAGGSLLARGIRHGAAAARSPGALAASAIAPPAGPSAALWRCSRILLRNNAWEMLLRPLGNTMDNCSSLGSSAITSGKSAHSNWRLT